MDVLASPISSLLLPSNHRETLHLLKSPLSSSYSNLSSSKPNPRFSLSSSSSKPLLFLCASSTPPPPPSTLAARTHHRAATGYAAALIDFSRRGGAKSLAAIADDVHRLATSIASIIADSSKVDEERAAAVRAAVAHFIIPNYFNRNYYILIWCIGRDFHSFIQGPRPLKQSDLEKVLSSFRKSRKSPAGYQPTYQAPPWVRPTDPENDQVQNAISEISELMSHIMNRHSEALNP
ncbi:hypothetical protein MA16_Dca011320 [Dendrobium catenatum]|uniref:Uncharacterized protein n=1 Tax=Dendrobium catenatum TaxID=906689 RepID=A0A2I0WIQ3_9ASPA|nr:hypothetical protein MA16_Dca011320 [Dendrobium catenatum]